MAAFYPMQPVRIVRSDNRFYQHLVGRETYVVGRNPNPDWDNQAEYLIGIPREDGRGWIGANAEHLEPIRYLPDAFDLATQEGSPDFQIVAPVPALSMLGEGGA